MLEDGHTHTELCPHGSGEPVEKMIQRAIQLGMKKYCITEHAPLPPDIADSYAGSVDGIDEASIKVSELPEYFKLTRSLQKKYADQIEISIGFEIDYLQGFEEWTKDFLNEYGPETQESILSVHFMKGTDDKLWCVDDGVENFQSGFQQFLNDPQDVFRQYYQTVAASVDCDLGQYRPQRIGHMSLVRKYQDYFHLTEDLDENNLELVENILRKIKKQDRELDLNLAGLYKPLCNDFYPGKQILRMTQNLSIPLIYGSDAHDIKSVGHGIHLLKTLI
ncbi:histidinol-phosphatase HisJ [Companilactobacillus versmoldensis]|uniref:Histidinol-phosphatase n=1 Tax=Companilactobacillus versmoldensis DSM 14857 = KCTC 3814 TaxID=1423815 RepID=A0A0R1SCJ5_9LACO|nr:histidinol-phosphatase HisJ [Companilactobacillus versmoldensis]KRL66716.1 histidinol-phosphatase [Companilactobacillus versmoldensis DSM 14857 = KCTC 3814]